MQFYWVDQMRKSKVTRGAEGITGWVMYVKKAIYGRRECDTYLGGILYKFHISMFFFIFLF